jgi:hypothetical protein
MPPEMQNGSAFLFGLQLGHIGIGIVDQQNNRRPLSVFL